MRDFLAMYLPALQAADQLVNDSIERSDQAHLIELKKAINQYAAKALTVGQYIRSLGDMIPLHRYESSLGAL